MSAAANVAFTVLGRVGFTVGAADWSPTSPKQAAVLGALVDAVGERVSSDRIAEALWGATPPGRWSVTVASHVSRIRGALGDARTMLETLPRGYRLAAPPETVDGRQLVQLARRSSAAAASGDLEAALNTAETALGLVGGAPFGDLGDTEYFRVPAERLAEEIRQIQELRWDLLLAQRRVGHLVAPLREYARLHPLREHAWELLIRALYHDHRQADALHAYQEARAMLGEELGIEPGAALRALERAVLDQDDARVDERAAVRVAGTLTAVPPGDTHDTASLPSWLALGAPLVGRDDEGASLRAEWERVVDDGVPRVVTVEGEPGIGKTSLVAAFAHEVLEQGAPVIANRCDEDGLFAGEPIGEVVALLLGNDDGTDESLDALRQWTGRAPETDARHETLAHPGAGGPEVAQLAVLNAFRTLREKRFGAEPIVFVIDDLQWARPAGLSLLRQMVRLDALGTALVVATIRTGNTSDELAAALHGWDHERRHSTLSLGPLDREDLIALANEFGVSADAAVELANRCGGNPLFLAELARYEPSRSPADPDVPDTVRGVLLRRLLALSDRTRLVLGVASVAGTDVPIDLLADAQGIEPVLVDDALEEARVASLVRATPDGYEFAHAVFRDVLLDGLGRTRRAQLAYRIGAALDRRPDATKHPRAIVQHFCNAVTAEPDARLRALDHTKAAANDALRAGMWTDALHIYETVDACFVDHPDERPAWFVLDLLAIQFTSGRLERRPELVGLFERSIAAGDRSVAIDAVLLERVMTAVPTTEWVRRAESALAASGYRDAGTDRVATLRAELGALVSGPDPARGAALLAAAHTHAQRSDPRVRRRIALISSSRVDPAYDLDARIRDLGPCLEPPMDPADLPVFWMARNRLAMHLLGGGRLEESAAIDDASRADPATQSQARSRCGHHQRAAAIALLRGDFVGAERAAGEAVDEFPTPDVLDGFSAQLMAIRLEQGRCAEIIDAAQHIADESPEPVRLAALATLAAEVGDRDRAARALARIGALQTIPVDGRWLVTMCTIGYAAALTDDRRAGLLLDVLAPFAGRYATLPSSVVNWGLVDRFLALLAAACGSHTLTIEHNDTSLRAHEAMGAEPFRARDLLLRATLTASGDDARGALAIAERLGMRAVAEDGRAVLAGLEP